MLAHKMPQETGDDAAFRRRMKAGKQLGSAHGGWLWQSEGLQGALSGSLR